MENDFSQFYLCGHSVLSMIETEFFSRFSDFNEEGFCYTWSAIMMLGLKNFKHTRIVRGYIDLPNYQSYHSWVEIRICGRWWVIDSNCEQLGTLIPRKWHRRKYRPKILVVYKYREFWSDPLAMTFYERLQKPETSKILCEIHYHYTPLEGDSKIKGMGRTEIEFLDNPYYLIFPPNFGYKFDQRIINELMARPTRRSPKRRTLRRLDSFYREVERECESAQESPA